MSSLSLANSTTRRSGDPWRPDRLTPYVLIAPTVVVMLSLSAVPLLGAAYISLTDARVVSAARFVGLANYVYLLTVDPDFWRVVWQTALWTVVTVGAEYVIGLSIALLLNRGLRYQNVFRGLILLPWIVPPVSAGLIWLTLYADDGIFNKALEAVGLHPLFWLGNPHIVLYSLMGVAVWKYLPFMIVGLLAGLQAIPQELYEAAKIDGCSAWQRLIWITLPMLMPVTLVLLLLQLIWRAGHFDLVQLITEGGPANRSQLIATFAYAKTISNLQAGMGAAVAIIGVGALVVLVPFFVRRLAR